MTPEELEHGYAWIYQRLFSHASIWRRGRSDRKPFRSPRNVVSVQRSNRFWHLLIKHDLVDAVWKPLVELTRWRHVHYRRKLARSEEAVGSGQVVSAGV